MPPAEQDEYLIQFFQRSEKYPVCSNKENYFILFLSDLLHGLLTLTDHLGTDK